MSGLELRRAAVSEGHVPMQLVGYLRCMGRGQGDNLSASAVSRSDGGAIPKALLEAREHDRLARSLTQVSDLSRHACSLVRRGDSWKVLQIDADSPLPKTFSLEVEDPRDLTAVHDRYEEHLRALASA